MHIKENHTKVKFKFTQSVLLIPCITALCGMIAGIVDPYTKVQLLKISSTTGAYLNRIATIWILQAALSMIFGEILKRDFFIKKILTPAFLISWLMIELCVKNLIPVFSYTIVCCIGYLFFKTLKYSAHSPNKEAYIRSHHEMNNILVFEGFAGRFGKNFIAIILAILFSFGYKWLDIENISLIICIILSFFWFLLSLSM
jgi:hypothetical protein